MKLWTVTWTRDNRFRGFNRLSHEELTKTNYQNIYPKGNKTPDLELVTS